MSKRLWFALTLVLALALGLAACKKATPTPEPTKAQESALGATAGDLQGVTVEFWHVWSRRVGEALEALVKEFNETNEWGITVQPINQGGYGDMFNKMNAAINTGELPDLVVGYQNQMLVWDGDGDIIVDLNPYVNDPEVGLSKEEQDDFYPVFWEQDLINGKRYGMPVQRSAQYMFYNVTWAKELGFDKPPATPEEFYEQACLQYPRGQGGPHLPQEAVRRWLRLDYRKPLSQP